MHLCKCLVHVGGSPDMVVARERVTVPEIMVLRAIHGDDAVRQIELMGEESFESQEERERLAAAYPKGNVVREVLGAVGALPKTLEEANIPEDMIVGSMGRKGGRKKSAATAVEVDQEL